LGLKPKIENVQTKIQAKRPSVMSQFKVPKNNSNNSSDVSPSPFKGHKKYNSITSRRETFLSPIGRRVPVFARFHRAKAVRV
jgi:hypothetical protein